MEAAGACVSGPAAAVFIGKAALDWFITPQVKDAATTALELGAYKEAQVHDHSRDLHTDTTVHRHAIHPAGVSGKAELWSEY